MALEKLSPPTLFLVPVFSVQGTRLAPASAHLKAGFPESLALPKGPHEDLRLTDYGLDHPAVHDTHPGTGVCIILYEIRLKRQDGCDLFAVGFGLQSSVYHLLRHGRLCTLRINHLSDYLFSRHLSYLV